MKNQKGITLVALVVTIIVLLILAAVSLSLVAGSDGLLNRASNAVEQTTIKSAQEQAELAIETAIADYYYDKYAANSATVSATASMQLPGYVGNKIGTTGISVGNGATLKSNTDNTTATTATFTITYSDGKVSSAELNSNGNLGTWSAPTTPAGSGG